MVDVEVDSQCAAIIDRCLQKDPADRYPSAGHLATVLYEVLASERPTDWAPSQPTVSMVDRDSQGSSARRRERRHWWNRIRLQSAIVALVALLAFVGMRYVPGWLEPEVDRTGVAVLPFTFMGAVDQDEALGHGLAWHLNDRLTEYEGDSDEFWMVPPGAVQVYEIVDAEEALDRMGAYRIVSGQGRRTGSTIDLRIIVTDRRSGDRHERNFQDTVANLQTWQEDIVAWVAGVLDPRFLDNSNIVTGNSLTSVPTAFLEYCRGMGYLHRGLAGKDAEVEPAIAALANSVEADSSYIRARAELGYRIWSLYQLDEPERAKDGYAELVEAIQEQFAAG